MSIHIGPENNLSAKLILLNVKNKKQFINLCNINITIGVCEFHYNFVKLYLKFCNEN